MLDIITALVCKTCPSIHKVVFCTMGGERHVTYRLTITFLRGKFSAGGGKWPENRERRLLTGHEKRLLHITIARNVDAIIEPVIQQTNKHCISWCGSPAKLASCIWYIPYVEIPLGSDLIYPL